LNKPELTAERFIKNPFSKDPTDRLYRTGDLVKYLPDGNLVFLGRIDHQVKLRGFRIELGEVANVLSSHTMVQDAVVTLHEHTHLVGYVALGQPVDKIEDGFILRLLEHAKEELPHYMVPSFIVPLETLPLTPNGKVDRKALPKPSVSAMQEQYVPPATETEKQLAGIWKELLGVEQIGIHDNFFHLGGHSLMSIQLIGLLKSEGWQVTAHEVFTHPTLGGLASRIRPYLDTYVVPENLITTESKIITPEMLPLVQEISESALEGLVSKIPGGVSNIQDIYPLAPLQEGIFFHSRLEEGEKDPYVLSSTLSFTTEKQRAAFIDALRPIVQRHDVLRTSFHWEGLSEPIQVVHRKAVISTELLTLDVKEGETVLEVLKRYISHDNVLIDLECAPLMKVNYIDDKPLGKHYILFSWHHIINDHIGLEQII
ncbi:MAG: condensation domain-containing protein, partial [Halobacteriota archaeon]|nr:condensation domain-containing protein [Halobacteriota archaeon]